MGSIVEMTQDRTSELQNRSIEFIQSEQQRESRQNKKEGGGGEGKGEEEQEEQSLRVLWDSNKRSSIHIITSQNDMRKTVELKSI